MKKLVEIKPVCPFVNGKCIGDGWECSTYVQRPCEFWDGGEVYNGISPDEPCKIKRAINRILANEFENCTENMPIDFPWETDEKE